MTNPTEKTLKPSDSILHRVNATREPNQRTLTLAGGWEPGDTQSVVIAMLRDLDEQHAAQSAPPRLTEKPFFEGLAEHQKRSRESMQWSRQFLSTVGDSNLCAHCGKAYLEHRYVTSGGVSISYCPVVAPIAEPPAPEAGEPGVTNYTESHAPHHDRGLLKIWEEYAPELDACHGEFDPLLEALNQAHNEALNYAKDHFEPKLATVATERDAALSQVEELKAELARCPEAHAAIASELAAERRALASANARAVAGNAELDRLKQNIAVAWECSAGEHAERIETLSKLTAATSRAEAVEGRVRELEAELLRIHSAEGAGETATEWVETVQRWAKDGPLDDAETSLLLFELFKEGLIDFANPNRTEATEPPMATAERPIVVGSVWLARDDNNDSVVVLGSSHEFRVYYRWVLNANITGDRSPRGFRDDFVWHSDPPAPQELDSEGKP